MRLALFDLDNTLIAGDSDFEWAQFLISRGVLDREVYEAKNLEFYEQYKAGTLDIHAFLDFQLKPLSRHPRSQLDVWHAEFLETRIKPMITDKAQALVQKHAQAGDTLIVITATNSFVTAPIVREFGIANLIATEPEHKGGEFTGRVYGTPSFRQGKVARLEQWLAERGASLAGAERSWFYSDSHNDLFLMERVSDPVAVDADAELTRVARERGWPHISLR